MYSNENGHISEKDIKVIFLITLYKIILDLVYIFYISPIYNYAPGYNLSVNMGKYFLSWLFFLVVVLVLPKTNTKVSYMVLQLHTLIMIIPMLTIYALTDKSSVFMIMFMTCFLFEVIAIKKTKFVFKLPTILKGRYIVVFLIILCTIVDYAYVINLNGIHWEALDFSTIYAIRANSVSPTGFLGYLLTWQYRILTPYIIVSSYLKRNKGTLIVFTGLQVLLYFVIPHKEIILSAVLLISLIVLLEKLDFLKSGISAIILAIIGSVTLYVSKISIMAIAILPTRLLIEPSVIKFQHFEVFSKYLDKLYYSEGLIGRLLGIDYPYNQASGVVVHSFFSSTISNSNTGYLAYAYDNMGVLGMVLITMLFIFIMIIIDSLSVNLNKNYVFSLIIYQMFMLNDGDLFTCLLSGGLLITFIILSFDQESFRYKKGYIESKNKEENIDSLKKKV